MVYAVAPAAFVTMLLVSSNCGVTARAAAAATKASTADDVRARVIRFLEDRVRRDPDDVTAQNRLAGEYLRRFRQSGDDHDLTLAAAAATESLHSVPAANNPAGLGARARVVFAFHGFAAARDMALQLVDLGTGKRYPFEILGDSLLELGDYDAASEAYKKMEAFDETDASTESRMARLELIRGNIDQACHRLDSAVELQRQSVVPEPDLIAWCHTQRGQLAFNTGDWECAETHYLAALEASPRDWSAADHLAELRAAQKRFPEAISRYEALVARVPRPELLQALGDVYTAMGKRDQAALWHHQALEKYTAAAAQSPHYYHHLAGFYSDTEPNAAEAVKWAKKDMEIRHSVYAYDALAWALYQAGDAKAAAEATDKALALGTKDSHMLYHASLIYFRAGDAAKARKCLVDAATVNPKFNEFHVHR